MFMQKTLSSDFTPTQKKAGKIEEGKYWEEGRCKEIYPHITEDEILILSDTHSFNTEIREKLLDVLCCIITPF